jgi:hypothetical protein
MLTQVAAENFLSPLIEINFTSRQRRKKVFFSSLKNVRRRPALELNQMENPSNETICPFIKNKSLLLLHRDWLYLIFAPHPSGGDGLALFTDMKNLVRKIGNLKNTFGERRGKICMVEK